MNRRSCSCTASRTITTSIDYVCEHPERIDHLVLMDIYYGHSPALRLPEMIRLLADPDLAPLADAMVADPAQLLWLVQFIGRQFFGTDEVPPDGIAAVSILPQFFAGTENEDALPAIRGWTGALFADLDHQDRRIDTGQLAAISTPVTLMVGADDAYLGPALARRLAEYFAVADVVVVPGASHWPQWDQPEDVAVQLLAMGAAEQPGRDAGSLQ
jgi:haloalkane dehalogenase